MLANEMTAAPAAHLKITTTMVGASASQAEVGDICYGHLHTWFGHCTAAFTDTGLCWLSPDTDSAAMGEAEPSGQTCPEPSHEELQQFLPSAVCVRNDIATQQRMNDMLAGDAAAVVHLFGSEFQLRVWQQLLEIPFGARTTYGEIAHRLGDAGFARAVGSAVGRNPVAWIVPCHRVLPAAGGMGGYRWGVALKRLLLEAEAENTALI